MYLAKHNRPNDDNQRQMTCTQAIAFIADVERITGLHRSTLRRKWKAGLFPAPSMIDGTRLAWRTESIKQWIDITFTQNVQGVQNNEQSNKRYIVTKVLAALLNGEVLNRKSLELLNIHQNNSSLHSFISTLRNRRHIPIESEVTQDGTCNYYMTKTEIARYHEPMLRAQQKKEVRSAIERERQVKRVEMFIQFLTKLFEYPDLWLYWSELPSQLSEISSEINALLARMESANQ